MSSRSCFRWLALGVLLAAPLPAAPRDDRVAAEALFDAGRKLMAEGNFDEACKKLEESEQADPAVGTLLYLGECYEKQGRTATAWATFREAASLAESTKQAARAKVGNKRAQKLEGKLSHLTIEISADAAGISGLVLLRDGKPLESGLFGVAFPVDPGDHTIEATAPEHEPWKQVVTVPAAGGSAKIVVPALVAAAPTPAAAPAASATAEAPAPAYERPAPTPAPARPVDDGGSDGSAQRTWGLVLGAAGLVGIGVGTWAGLTASAKNSDAKAACPRSPACDTEEGVSLTHDAESAAALSNVAFGVGGAALVGGAVLWFTAPSGRPESALKLGPRVGAGRTEIVLGGRF